MLAVRHSRPAVPPALSANARWRPQAPHRTRGALAAALFALALVAPAAAVSAGPIPAADIINPTVIAIDPASAPNDIDTPVVITGTDFAAVMDGTGTVVVTSPTASLGSTALTNVTWVNSTTLTATVPWGLDPGAYTLTVVNPDGGTGSLAGAFTVTQGIGQWNGGTLFGGDVLQLLMKPGDPSTLYALAYDVGLFRSRDAGEHWSFIWGNVIANRDFEIDPLHPTWLYSCAWDGLYRSQDEGDTWTKLMGTWPDGRAIGQGRVYVSPHDPQVLFLGSYNEPAGDSPGGASGLIKSTDGGASWQIVADMEGIGVEDVDFDPTDPLQMVLATPEARVFQSSDGGDTWKDATKPPISSLGLGAVIAYNPFRPSEVWITSAYAIYKSTDATLTSWQDVTPTHDMRATDVTFTSADSVYVSWYHSEDGGLNWQRFGPLNHTGTIKFDPADSQIGYIGDATYGVQKTTDGGQTWEIKNQGLTGMFCSSMDVSRADPLRVYAIFGGWPGIYRSNDGAGNWTYLPIAGSLAVGGIREDPFDPQRLYAMSHSGFYVSTNGGESWSDLGWNASPSWPAGMLWQMAADPYQPGHLLVGMVSINGHLTGPARLYSSSDYGASWQQVTMPQDVAWITDIVFGSQTSGLVYLTTNGTGVYRSTDGGTSWARIDDLGQPGMQGANSIAIATRPQPMLVVEASSSYRSLDGGATWVSTRSSPPGHRGYLFVDGDSTRLYAGTFFGLYFSSDAGDSWTRAAGVLGGLKVTALGYADADGHTILYAGTSGGAAAGFGSTAATRSPKVLSTTSTLVDAGIYRRVQVPTTKTFTSSGAQDGWILESRHTSNKGGTLNATAATFRLGDNAAKKQYRGILSFSTGAGLPDTAVITKVTLRVKRQGVAGGGNPVTIFRGFLLDIKNGTFGTAALQTSDFQAAASRSYGPFKPAPIRTWYSIDLTGAKAYVNKLSSRSGRTHIRLRFKLDDNNNAVANYLNLYSGNASVAARPQLIVTYYVP